VDGESFAAIAAAGLAAWLAGIRQDLSARTYRPAPVRRVMIPKPGGGERPARHPNNPDAAVAGLIGNMKRSGCGSAAAVRPTHLAGAVRRMPSRRQEAALLRAGHTLLRAHRLLGGMLRYEVVRRRRLGYH
jgi:hypothetical protein